MTKTRRLATAVLVLALFGCTGGTSSKVPSTGEWGGARLIQPAELAAALADSAAARPMLVHVGFRPLYRAGAIPGSLYAGPGSQPAGLDSLLAAVAGQAKTANIVIYCGCCPSDHCPNMKPAFAALRDAGYTNVKALWIAKNFDADWAGHGYPTAKPEP